MLQAFGIEKAFAYQVVETFVTLVGPGKYFKALKFIIKAASYAKNFRKALTVAEASSKNAALGRSMMKAANAFTDTVLKNARKEIIKEGIAVAREGSVAVLEAAFGTSDATGESLYSVYGTRRTMKRSVSGFAFDKSAVIHADRRSDDPGAATLSMEFGVENGQAYQTLVNMLKTEGLLTASHGFDINEFGLLDESTTTLEECTRSQVGVSNTVNRFTETEDCKIIYMGTPVVLNARIVILKSKFSTSNQKTTLLAAISKSCGFIAASSSTNRVQMGQSVDMTCGNDICSQADFSIAATSHEVKTHLQVKISLQSVRDAHSSLTSRRSTSFSSDIKSVEICDGQCGACPLGKYGEVSSCIDCPGGTYSNSQSATSVSSCVSCRQNSHSPSGSYNEWHCSCNAGFIQSTTHTCTLCESGKYSTIVSTSCMTCPLNTISPQGSTGVNDCKCSASFFGPDGGQCEPCPTNSDSLAGSTCTCNAGFMGPASAGSPCVSCVPGKYKDAASTECKECVSGTYSTVMAATSSNTCSDCPSLSFSPSGSNAQRDCTCNAGYMSESAAAVHTCVGCAPGKFSLSSSAECRDCGKGTYSVALATTSCLLCSVGKYSGTLGGTSATVCLICPTGKTAAEGTTISLDCIDECPAGFTGPFVGSCDQCPPSTFKAITGSTECIQCASGSFSPSASIACQDCPTGKYSESAASWTQANRCSDCATGKFKSSAGVGVCLVCPAQAHSISGSQFCSCDAGSISVSESAVPHCVCDAGFALASLSAGNLGVISSTANATLSEVCILCPAGTCKPSVGDHSCDISSCPMRSPRMSPNGGVFMGFVEIIVTTEMPMVITLDAEEPVCGSSRVNSHILTLLSSTTVKVRACFDTRESDVSSASFKVLPAFVVKVSFMMDGINADEINQDVIDNFFKAFANELGVAKERLINLNFKDARRRLFDVSMSFDLIASSAADAQLLSMMVYRDRHMLAHITP